MTVNNCHGVPVTNDPAVTIHAVPKVSKLELNLKDVRLNESFNINVYYFEGDCSDILNCVEFIWDFGDGTRELHTHSRDVNHTYTR